INEVRVMSFLTSRGVRWSTVCIGGVLVAGGAIFVARSLAPKPLVRADRLGFLLSKAEKEREELERADKANEAMAFYVNKRTGPFLTRGANITTGMRTLDTSFYVTAIQQTALMPRFSTAGGGIQPAEINAPPGGALSTWTSLGPSNQGGRTRQLLID